jgi:hypothetical protein
LKILLPNNGGYFNEEEGKFHIIIHPKEYNGTPMRKRLFMLDNMHGTTRGTKSVKHGT